MTGLKDAEEKADEKIAWMNRLAREFWQGRPNEVPDWSSLLFDPDCPIAFWTHKCDLTFAVDVTAAQAFRSLRTFMGTISAWIDTHVAAVFVVAETPISRRPHIHAMLSIPPYGIDGALLGRLWRRPGRPNGRHSEFAVCDDRLGNGALRYMLRHGDPEFHVECPRDKCRGRCGARKIRASEVVLLLAKDRER